MHKYYVTFGQIHIHRIQGRTLDRDCVAVMNVNSYEEGRRKATEYFGGKFCFDYIDDEWDEDDLKYYPRGYIELK